VALVGSWLEGHFWKKGAYVHSTYVQVRRGTFSPGANVLELELGSVDSIF
jgi:hypothetical protein